MQASLDRSFEGSNLSFATPILVNPIQNRWKIMLILSIPFTAVLFICILMICSRDEDGHATSRATTEVKKSESHEDRAQKLPALIGGGSSPVSDDEFITLVQEKTPTGKSPTQALGAEMIEESTPDPVPPPFLYEINRTKVTALNVDQQVAVHKAFEKYLADPEILSPAADPDKLREISERIREELSTEIGPMTVHDLMQSQ